VSRDPLEALVVTLAKARPVLDASADVRVGTRLRDAVARDLVERQRTMARRKSWRCRIRLYLAVAAVAGSAVAAWNGSAVQNRHWSPQSEARSPGGAVTPPLFMSARERRVSIVALGSVPDPAVVAQLALPKIAAFPIGKYGVIDLDPSAPWTAAFTPIPAPPAWPAPLHPVPRDKKLAAIPAPAREPISDSLDDLDRVSADLSSLGDLLPNLHVQSNGVGESAESAPMAAVAGGVLEIASDSPQPDAAPQAAPREGRAVGNGSDEPQDMRILYVIDDVFVSHGVVVAGSRARAAAGAACRTVSWTSPTSVLAELDPSDIAAVRVLASASSTHRCAVVGVTTKSRTVARLVIAKQQRS
jgi:hypothetical protein